jgi:Tol biopolymer transport system component
LALTLGTRLGVYEVTAPIGEGGMGQVYRARDTTLNRDVALKVLPDSFANDPDRLARFQREAQVLASLNHPHIAHIYGLEHSDGVRALVMELVEGEDLAQRIARGPIPIDEALLIAKQIAEGLEVAHEQGVIHRDLKPANIKVRPDGTVKILDFGLAKAMESTGAMSPNVSQSPTITTPAMTQAGIILGTAAYMSPEQARGKTVDKRVDIWAFGCVLYEMLTGRRAFEGEDVSDTLANVLKSEPEWQALPVDLPEHIRLLVRRCLEKDRSKRVTEASTARFLITEPVTSPTSAVTSIGAFTSRPLWRRAVPVVLSAMVAAAITGTTVWWYAGRPLAPSVGRFFVYPPEKNTFVAASRVVAGVALSPDGSNLAFTARDASGKVLLWTRRMDALTAQPLPGTDEAAYPFWSPDSRFLGYFAQGKLLKIALGGGPPQPLCNTGFTEVFGGTWSRDGAIVFSTGPGRPLSRVSSAGGEPSEFMRPANGQSGYTFPWFLPDGRHLLVYASGSNAGVYVGSLDAPDVKRLAGADTAAVYDSHSGHMLFVRGETLLAQPFDPKTLALMGESFPIAESVGRSTSTLVRAWSAFSVSNNGILAYGVGTGTSTALQLSRFDRQGKQMEAVGPVGNYRGLDLALDGQHVATHRHDGNGGDIWVTDLSRNTTSRFTFDASQENSSPIWSHDGTRLVYASTRNGKSGLYQKLANNAGSEERLIEFDVPALPMSWSPDGRSVVYEVDDPSKGRALWLLPLSGDRKPSPFQTPFLASHGQISPDGKWLAYHSSATGRNEVYVQPFPSGPGQWQITTSGGAFPRWRSDGRELFYMSQASRGKMSVVDVPSSGTTFEHGAPQELFDSPYVNLLHPGGPYHTYAVSADGQHFLIPHPASSGGTANVTSPIVVVLNWAASPHGPN